MIRAKEVNVIGATGDPLGVFPLAQAMELARENEMDLVEVAPTAKPPVCKIMDYGKFKYKQSKRAHEARKNQKTVHIKEVKFRPNTDQHDYDFKKNHAVRFLQEGNKVKATVFFRGREVTHANLGEKLIFKLASDLKELGEVEGRPRLEGRMMHVIIAPKKNK